MNRKMNWEQSDTAHAPQAPAPCARQLEKLRTSLLPGLLTGCGFCLAFGWLWFPALRQVLLPGLFSQAKQEGSGFAENGIFIAVFSMFMVAGFILSALVDILLCKRAAAPNSGSHLCRNAPRSASLTHGLALTLLFLVFLVRKYSFDTLAWGALMGLSASLPGVYWTARLLRLKEYGASGVVGALAWAALLAVLLSLAGSWLPLFSFAAAAWSIGAGLTLAWLLALLLLHGETARREAHSPREDSLLPCGLLPVGFFQNSFAPGSLASVFFPAVIPLILFLLFFALGSLHTLAETAPGLLAAIAHLCGVGVLLLLSRVPSLFAFPFRTYLAAALCLAVFGFVLLFAPVTDFFLNFGSGFCEALALALWAAWLAGRGEAEENTEFTLFTLFPAAAFLILVLTAVNCGYLAGWELTAIPGGFGPLLPLFFLALLLALAASRVGKSVASYGPATKTPPDTIEGAATATGESGQDSGSAPGALPGALTATLSDTLADTLSGTSSGADAFTAKVSVLNPALEHLLTLREQAVALMIIHGQSNKSISEGLGLKEDTVRWYIKKLNRKIGSTNRDELRTLLLRQ